MKVGRKIWAGWLGLAWVCGVVQAETPYERLWPRTSVWAQEVEADRWRGVAPAEYRETLGVFPVGNGRCFAYLGLGLPQNTLFMMTGPRYQTEGDHNPLGGFGELALRLEEDGRGVGLPRQSCRTVRGAPVVLTSEEGDRLRLTTVTWAPPGVDALLRWVTVERLGGVRGAVDVRLEFRGREMRRDAAGVYFEYPHRQRVARMRPVVAGVETRVEGGAMGVRVEGLAVGAPRTFLVALVFSESAEAEAATRLRVVGEAERMLAETLGWWEGKLAPTLRVRSGDRRLDDLVEGLKVLLLVQQDEQGGVSPMVNFKGVWLRDSNGPLLGFLHTGLYEEARRLMTYYRQASALHRFTHRQFPLDLEVGADPDLTVEEWASSGTDRCEVPSFVAIQHGWWWDATGDRGLVERHWAYIKRNAEHQVLVEGPQGPLQTFNGDETYLGGAYYSLFPARSGYPNGLMREDAFSLDSMFEYAVAQEVMARLARAVGREGEAGRFEEAGLRMRASIEAHGWLAAEGRYAPALSPVDYTPHRAPFAPINLRPLWLGYLTPGDPRAHSNLEGTFRWLARPDGLVRMTPFLEHFIGCAPGYWVYNLAAVRHPWVGRAFEATMGSASASGEWVEVHRADRPSYGYGDGAYANRLRPWESGINLDALLFYLTGARRVDGRSIRLDPLMPVGCDRFVVENLPIGAARLRLEVERAGGKARCAVVNVSGQEVAVNGAPLGAGEVRRWEVVLPGAPAGEPEAPGGYREPLRWRESVRTLVLTADRLPAAPGVQHLDVGLPFSPEDLAGLLAARPATLERIQVHPSAQRFDRRTLKPLDRVLESAAVKAELAAFQRGGGTVDVPRYVRRFALYGPWPDPDQELLKTDPDILTRPFEPREWRVYESPAAYVNLDAVMRPNERVAALARCVVASDRPRRLALQVGADDGVVVWVGGRRVLERLGHHHHEFDRDRVVVEVPAGETAVVVGVHEIGGAWGFSLRMADEDGTAPAGVTLVD